MVRPDAPFGPPNGPETPADGTSPVHQASHLGIRAQAGLRIFLDDSWESGAPDDVVTELQSVYNTANPVPTTGAEGAEMWGIGAYGGRLLGSSGTGSGFVSAEQMAASSPPGWRPRSG